MPDKTYKTTRAPGTTKALARNAVLVSLTSAMMIWQWLDGGGALFAILAFATGALAALVLWTLYYSRVPLEISRDSVIVRTAMSSEIPLRNVEKIGEHPTRKTPSLSYSEPIKGHIGEIALPWKYIAEPQDDVLEKLRAAIAKEKANS